MKKGKKRRKIKREKEDPCVEEKEKNKEKGLRFPMF